MDPIAVISLISFLVVLGIWVVVPTKVPEKH